jgi:flagellar FliL protein
VATAPEAEQKAAGTKGVVVVAAVVVLVAVGFGLGAAYLLTRPASSAPPPAGSAASADSGAADYEYVPFGTTVVNLAEGRLTRYLQVTLILKVSKSLAPAIRDRMTAEKAVFQHWLITHLSDKKLEDVEGAAAITRVKREIEDGFNAILAEGGKPDKIDAVLFEEFNVQ